MSNNFLVFAWICCDENSFFSWHVFLIMKCLLTKRLYYRLTRRFHSYHQPMKCTNQENNRSYDKRLMNFVFHEKNSSQDSNVDTKKKRFVIKCLVCM